MKLSEVDVVILCGGLGTRLRDTIGASQKAMAHVGDEPFLNKVLRYLKAEGFQRIILATGFRGDQVEAYYSQNSLGLTFAFSHEKEPLGTGGAIKNTQSFVKSNVFFALNGDCFCAMDYEGFFEYHQSHHNVATLSVTKIQDSRDYGTIVLDEHKTILGFEEKKDRPGGGLVNVGAYCFNREIFALMPTVDKFSIEKDFFPFLPAKLQSRFGGFVIEDEFLDIGTPDRYQQAEDMIRKAQQRGHKS